MTQFPFLTALFSVCVSAQKRLACFHAEQFATPFCLCLFECEKRLACLLNDSVCFFRKIVKFACIKKRICNIHQVAQANWLLWMILRLETAFVLVGKYLEEKQEGKIFILDIESPGKTYFRVICRRKWCISGTVQDEPQLVLETMLYNKASSSS